MRVRILGSAAGGGLPQWNCRCANCEATRRGTGNVQPRTQSSIAVSADGRSWFLLNVSADVRAQLNAFESLWPPPDQGRGTSIAGCLLTDAEIDHTSGLLQLREGCRFTVYSTPTVHKWLTDDLPIGPILGAFADRPWVDLPPDDDVLQLPHADGTFSGLRVQTIELGHEVPRFVAACDSELPGARIGLQIEDASTGGKLVYAPGLSQIDNRLDAAARAADCLLIDGTFWSDDEPRQMGIVNKSAHEMGHLPVDGPGGTLAWLAGLPVKCRVYVHINNTNPMLNEAGTQFSKVTGCGVRVGRDGDEFDI